LEFMSPGALLGKYSNLRGDSYHVMTALDELKLLKETQAREKEKEIMMLKHLARARKDDHGRLDFDAFVKVSYDLGMKWPTHDLQKLFDLSDKDRDGRLEVGECEAILKMDPCAVLRMLATVDQEVSAMHVVVPSIEKYFGEQLRGSTPKGMDWQIVESQALSMQLYESRIASLQRAVAFFVLFHEMGKCVADFWPAVSFGLLGYGIDRTHSIMRIATTASPVSGSDVRGMMHHLALRKYWEKLGRDFTYLQKLWRSKRPRSYPRSDQASVKSSKKSLEVSSSLRNDELIETDM